MSDKLIPWEKVDQIFVSDNANHIVLMVKEAGVLGKYALSNITCGLRKFERKQCCEALQPFANDNQIPMTYKSVLPWMNSFIAFVMVVGCLLLMSAIKPMDHLKMMLERGAPTPMLRAAGF